MPKIKRYTEAELDFIAAALAQGYQKQQVAAFFGITSAAISFVIHRHGLEPEEPEPPSESDLRTLGRQYGLLSESEFRELKAAALERYSTLDKSK